ncbi:MAG: DEAD/DEAH box helicase [Eubacteriales bacterium SKADARSKE-1]|nr:DEAD/DEAH box helicase [Eubacteriales bacterium SKADARSKE-1]
MEFKEINLSPKMLKALNKMGFTKATPVQEQTISIMLDKKDMIVQAPTGSGKTCAFGIPIIEAIDIKKRTTQSIILCPTRELVIQTTDVLHKLTLYMHGIRISAIYGGARISSQITALRSKPQIIVATPGRIMDHIRRKTVALEQVNLVVLDEADRMLDMGFRDDIDTIFKNIPKQHQTILFSATISDSIKRIAKEYQSDAKMVHIKQEALTVDAVKHYYIKIPKGGKFNALESLIKEKKFNRSLIFVGTKSMADTLTLKLLKSGFTAKALHGDLRQRQRDAVMDKYRKGLVNILVATDVAARGIDVNNIDAVINFDIPDSSDSYVHRIGRTGRANQDGIAYTFIYAKEQSKLGSIVRDTKAVISPILINNIVCDELTKQPYKCDVKKQKNSGAKPYSRRNLRRASLKSNKAR